MSYGATKDYDFKEKNRWRVRLWDEVLRRTNGREECELILYLAGPEDIDRTVAVRKGVPSPNLIAIDRNKKTVESIRSDGNAAICGDVYDVLAAWPKASPVCAIVLDLCQGFQKLDDLKRLMKLTTVHPALKNVVLSVNMQRGRDAETNDMREVVGHFIGRHMHGVDPKHRGMIFGLWYIGQYITECPTLRDILSSATEQTIEPIWNAVLGCFNLKTYTYRSGGLCFDSLVVTSGGTLFDIDPRHADWVKPFLKTGKRSVALSTAAILAVRTRRMRHGRAI